MSFSPPPIFTREYRAAAKEEAGEDGKKKRGGVSVPEEWPWEQAKKVFEKPDVTPADQIEVFVFP